MTVLYISDQLEGSNHTSVEAVFSKYLKNFAAVRVVYFSRERKSAAVLDDGMVVLPYRQRGRAVSALKGLFDLESFDIVIVRNYYDTLKDALKNKKEFGFNVGFQLSFPHTFRRYYEAKRDNKAVLRKSVEYRLKSFFEKKLLERVDFFLPISDEMYRSLYAWIQKAVFALPTGVDFENLPPIVDGRVDDETVRFVYIGTVDALRQLDAIVAAFEVVESKNWRLAIFTPNYDFASKLLEGFSEQTREKVEIYRALPRKELFERLGSYDVGIGLLPQTPLYTVSSPTKVMEYAALGLPQLLSRIPECVELFESEKAAFFCDFSTAQIAQKIGEILAMPKERLRSVGESAAKIVNDKRNYLKMSQELYEFLAKTGAKK